MENYIITKHNDKYKCQVGQIRYFIEIRHNYILGDQIGGQALFYLRDSPIRERFNTNNKLTSSESITLLHTVCDFCIKYGYENSLDFLIFKSAAVTIDGEPDFINDTRIKYFIRWAKMNLGEDSCTVEDNRGIVYLNKI